MIRNENSYDKYCTIPVEIEEREYRVYATLWMHDEKEQEGPHNKTVRTRTFLDSWEIEAVFDVTDNTKDVTILFKNHPAVENAVEETAAEILEDKNRVIK